MFKKIITFSIFILFVSLASASNINITINNPSIFNDTEYWALIIGVGIYAGHPDQDRENVLPEVEDLYDMLLVSTHWNEENIKVIKGENATLWNIYRGFRWLNQKESEGDFSLVYISTHGGQLSSDKWPWDEDDGCDEVLLSYRGFQLPFTNLRDDFLNLLLSLLNSKGVCVIVDSCYAGGFNDPPYFTGLIRNKKDFSHENSRINASEWMQELGEDLRGKGRVVLMASREEEISYCGVFTPLLIKGLTGYADTNDDKIVSAEEAFTYVKANIDPKYDQHPTIYDNYPSELLLTEVELPPFIPEAPKGETLGDTNTTYNYSTVSTDPEGGKIRYGWDLDGDFTVDEWTDPLDSNTTVNISHSWTVEGTYNLRVKAKDEKGLLSDWSNYTVVIMCDDNIPDQQQTNMGGSIYLPNFWVAQSFVPSLDTLSKVELAYISGYSSGDPPPIHIYIRDNLSGDNLVEFSRVLPEIDYNSYAWFTFDFKNLDVIPGKTYYIVCWTEKHWGYFWKWQSDCYPNGEAFTSVDGGNHWSVYNPSTDCCFVTWSKI